MARTSFEAIKNVAITALAWGVLGVVSAIGLTSCNNTQTPSDEQVREQAARATEKARQESKEALKNAQIAAAKAERKVDDVAQGIRDGMHGNTSPSAAGSRIDLNTVSSAELAGLPGISQEKARQIVRHRPYRNAHQLVERGILTQAQFDEISDEVTAR
jgi:DNA uptake protein ComE-like DNA-binding protein